MSAGRGLEAHLRKIQCARDFLLPLLNLAYASGRLEDEPFEVLTFMNRANECREKVTSCHVPVNSVADLSAIMWFRHELGGQWKTLTKHQLAMLKTLIDILPRKWREAQLNTFCQGLLHIADRAGSIKDTEATSWFVGLKYLNHCYSDLLANKFTLDCLTSCRVCCQIWRNFGVKNDHTLLMGDPQTNLIQDTRASTVAVDRQGRIDLFDNMEWECHFNHLRLLKDYFLHFLKVTRSLVGTSTHTAVNQFRLSAERTAYEITSGKQHPFMKLDSGLCSKSIDKKFKFVTDWYNIEIGMAFHEFTEHNLAVLVLLLDILPDQLKGHTPSELCHWYVQYCPADSVTSLTVELGRLNVHYQSSSRAKCTVGTWRDCKGCVSFVHEKAHLKSRMRRIKNDKADEEDTEGEYVNYPIYEEIEVKGKFPNVLPQFRPN